MKFLCIVYAHYKQKARNILRTVFGNRITVFQYLHNWKVSCAKLCSSSKEKCKSQMFASSTFFRKLVDFFPGDSIPITYFYFTWGIIFVLKSIITSRRITPYPISSTQKGIKISRSYHYYTSSRFQNKKDGLAPKEKHAFQCILKRCVI